MYFVNFRREDLRESRYCRSETEEAHSQLPKRRGQAWPSMGKSISFMGQSALMVSLRQVTHTHTPVVNTVQIL